MALEPGRQVGRYRIIRLLAQGGMAEVYRADQELAAGILRPVALKVIRPEYTESPEFREMFLDEARTACTLSHPNIVHIYEVADEAGLLYMAMELVPGETLTAVARRLRDKGSRLTDDALIAIGIFTCSALEAVHALKLPGGGSINLVHRDVSPHNLLLTPAGSLKLIDFGIAKAATNRNLTSAGVTKGKAGYFSPEQAMGKTLDGRSDLFSLGVTLYKLASGGTPFDALRTHQARSQALVKGEWKPLSAECPTLLPGLSAVVDKALQVNAANRYADAQAMREALESLAREAGVSVGQGALAGLVQIQEVPTGASAPRVAPPRVSAPVRTLEIEQPPASRRVSTDPAAPPKPPLRVPFRAALLLGVAVLVGALLAFVFARTGPSEKKRAPDVAIVAPVMAEAPVDAGRPLLALPEVPSAVSPVWREPEPPRTHRVAVRSDPRLKTKTPAPLPEAPAEIPKGQGRLRIGAVPDAEVSVSGKKWGVTPLDRELPSGVYTVDIQKLGTREQGRCKVTVWPDHTARLRYQFDDRKCTVGN